MFRLSVILLTCCLFTSSLHAKKHIWPFACVLHCADLIVVGEVTSVRSNKILLHIEERIHGDCPDTVITIAKWKEWTCDVRFAPYQKGQRLLLFLSKEKDHYAPINASTGELPMLQDSVRIHGADQRFALRELVTEIRDIRACFRTTSSYRPALSKDPSSLVIEYVCPMAGTPDPERIPKSRMWMHRQSIPYCPNCHPPIDKRGPRDAWTR